MTPHLPHLTPHISHIQVYKNIVNPGYAVHYPPSLSAQVWATLPPPLHPLRLTPTRV